MSWFKHAFLSRHQKREQSTFNALYRELAPRLFRRLIAKGHAQSIAEEAIHEAFLVYWDKCHAPILRGEHAEQVEEPYPWLLRIAQNKAIDVLRRATTAQEHKSGVENVLPQASTQEDSFMERDLLQQVLEQLEPRDTELLLLREGEGFSYDELAEELSLERGSVGTLLRRARQSFQRVHDELLNKQNNPE